MADSKNPEKSEKTIEMRLAEIEDKLSQLHVTEEDLKAYMKVSSLLGGVGAAGAAGAIPQVCVPSCQICVISRVPRIVPRIPRFVCECVCGPCDPFGTASGGGGGFSGFGF
jgi:hypothetical protein